MKTTRLSIPEYAVALAQTAAKRSEDQHRKVGCALVRNNHTVASLGYNGAPPGVELDWSDRDARRRSVIHAEANALRYVQPGECYLMATTLMPCPQCILQASAYGITEIYYLEELDPAVYDIPESLRVATMCGITMTRLTDV